AVVVEALREVALTFQRGRHAQADRVAAVDRGRGRTVLVSVEEEQLVGAAGLADRTADRVAERLGRGLRLGVTVLLTHPGIRVPVGVGEQAVAGPAELVGA